MLNTFRTATVICEDGYQLKKPSNNKVRRCNKKCAEDVSTVQFGINVLNQLTHQEYFEAFPDVQLVCREDGSWTASLGYEFPRCQVIMQREGSNPPHISKSIKFVFGLIERYKKTGFQEMGCLYDEMVVAPPDNGRVEVFEKTIIKILLSTVFS